MTRSLSETLTLPNELFTTCRLHPSPSVCLRRFDDPCIIACARNADVAPVDLYLNYGPTRYLVRPTFLGSAAALLNGPQNLLAHMYVKCFPPAFHYWMYSAVLCPSRVILTPAAVPREANALRQATNINPFSIPKNDMHTTALQQGTSKQRPAKVASLNAAMFSGRSRGAPSAGLKVRLSDNRFASWPERIKIEGQGEGDIKKRVPRRREIRQIVSILALIVVLLLMLMVVSHLTVTPPPPSEGASGPEFWTKCSTTALSPKS